MTYNDGYWPICGGKPPRSMGQDFSECWASAWPVIGEPFARALAGQASFIENQRMFLDRHGYLEETFFTFSFSPIRDETGGVGGVLNPCHETTARMLSERRTRALRDLSARTGKAKSVEDVLVLSAQTLTEYDLDLPFVLLYARDSNGQQLRLIARTGLQAGADACPDVLDLEESAGSFWPVAEVFRSGAAAQVDEIGQRLGPPPYGPYPEPPRRALLPPAIPTGAEHPAAVLVAGVSPRLPLNEAYSNFYDLLAAAVTAAIANARAFEAERKRSEALAEIDRAKTAFFSNVSHEFRTPLTLMLGPVEDMLSRSDSELSPAAKGQLEVVNRNGLRLLRLVNTLLDFSRIEAGRVRATYQPTDVSSFTCDLASVFRPACERAGLKLSVDCSPLTGRTYVDRDMWEKIVLNLLANAFKFTFEGEIAVTLRQVDDRAELGGSRHRHGHSRRRDAAPVRALSPRQQCARPHPRRQRHRAGAGAGTGQAARRKRARPQRARTGHDLYRDDPARLRSPPARADQPRPHDCFRGHGRFAIRRRGAALASGVRGSRR
jgi:signal transduction histidine kinase